MVEILDETPALNDPLFLEIWEGIGLKKQLEEAHRQLSIAISMPVTTQKTFLILIDNYKAELEEWFLDEPDEEHYKQLYKEMDQIGREVEECGDALQAMELYEKFTSTFARINEDTELEQTYANHWDGLERRTRELVRISSDFLLEGSSKILELNENIRQCEENYESLRFGIVRAAEEQIAERMTKRYQKMRLDFLKDICRIIRERHESLFKQQVDTFMDQVHERQRNRKRVNDLKSELRRLRIQYYTEPIQMERNLEQFRDQVLRNDQKIALLHSELKHLSEEVKQVDPVSSMKPEVSARQTPIYDIPEDKGKEGRRRVSEVELDPELLRERLEEEVPENDVIMIDVPKS